MEWMIMDCNGLNGLCGSLGYVVEGEYQIADDCHDTLSSILETLEDDNLLQRQSLRQLATSGILQQDLVPLVMAVQDDPDVFHLAIKLLMTLTQPIECLIQEAKVKHSNEGQLLWLPEVSQMLGQAKFSCANKDFIKAVFAEIRKIFEDAGEYDLVESDCESINQCLMLLRNLLHIEGIQGQNRQFDFLATLLECRLDDLLKLLLDTNRKEYWCVTIIQIISLMYRDLVGEVFLSVDDTGSCCCASSCDLTNCPHCEDVMDYGAKTDHVQDQIRASWQVILQDDDDGVGGDKGHNSTQSAVASTGNNIRDVLYSLDINKSESIISEPLEDKFDAKCLIAELKKNFMNAENGDICDSNGGIDLDLDETTTPCSCGASVKSDSDCTLSAEDDRTEQQEAEQCSLHTPGRRRSSTCKSLEDTSAQLVSFTINFLQDGFSTLVQTLNKTLLHQQASSRNLDDSYFLWSVAFFLKFARRKQIEFQKIKNVLNVEVFGFLVFEVVRNGEEMIHAFKKNTSFNLPMRRLHLSVCALRELIKTMTFHLMRGVTKDDHEYLENLQKSLSNMKDLRQMFLWLVHVFDSSCHSNVFLRDIIVTNHYFLLLLEDWLAKDFCKDKKVDMLSHVKQFGVPAVMQKYGVLLQNYVDNDHHVNNCVFTMMYHVAGDCGKLEVLLQPDILQTFTWILDAEVPVTTEMNELMDYVIHKFLLLAEEKPVSCAITLLGEAGTQAIQADIAPDTFTEAEWSNEEMDIISQWFTELEGSTIAVQKIAARFKDMGVEKSSIEIINYLYKMNLLSEKQLEHFLTSASEIQRQNQQNVAKQLDENNFLFVLQELSEMDDQNIVPHCLQKLREDKAGEQLSYLQECVLEAAYVKLEADIEPGEKRSQCEPVYKFYHAQGHDLPIIFYNEEMDLMRSSVYMVALMEQLGLHVDEEGIMYPRIPASLSVPELVQIAMSLGKIDEASLKFDLNMAMNHSSKMTKDIYDSGPLPHRKQSSHNIPAVAWMKMVNSFNVEESKSSMCSGNMETA